jgi:hypothetical protein
LLYVVNVARGAHILKEAVLLQLSKKLLRMRPGLRTSARADVLLDLVPILAIENESIQELVMFLISPLALVEAPLLAEIF